MTSVKTIACLVMAMTLSGCAIFATPEGAEVARSDVQAPSIVADDASAAPLSLERPVYDVQDITVDVPQTLVVSEANRYFPHGDIVWRGDPPGDRHKQVAAIFEQGLKEGTADLEGEVPVLVGVEILRFHSLSEKTRYSFGGVHSIRFELSIRSAESGLLLEPKRMIQADLEGFGGDEALAAERAGQTQKVRITDHLATVIKKELTDPSGYQNPKLGLIQAYDNTF